METSKLLGWAGSRNKQDSELMMAAEAILFVSGEAVSAAKLAEALDCETAQVEALLRELQARLQETGRGVQLRRVAGGYRLFSHPKCAQYVRVWLGGTGPRPLTKAALETLAIIAYRQPVSRAAVAAIRGVNSEAVIGGLTEKGLVAGVGKEARGGAILYGTTPLFLERFGLKNISELPPLEELRPDAGQERLASGEGADGAGREVAEGHGQGGSGL